MTQGSPSDPRADTPIIFNKGIGSRACLRASHRQAYLQRVHDGEDADEIGEQVVSLRKRETQIHRGPVVS